jgi:hypothetical protein
MANGGYPKSKNNVQIDARTAAGTIGTGLQLSSLGRFS